MFLRTCFSQGALFVSTMMSLVIVLNPIKTVHWSKGSVIHVPLGFTGHHSILAKTDSRSYLKQLLRVKCRQQGLN